jgi:hypothetical protein
VASLAKVAESNQKTALLVARIAGRLGINGSEDGGPAGPFQHHRENDQAEHLHKRLEDAAVAYEVATAALQKPGDGIVLPRWAVYSSAAVLLLIVVLAAIAGERSIPVIIDGIGKAKAVAK